MRVQPIVASQSRRIVAGIPFVEALARRMAASMPNSIDIGDLVQDGVIGLIDAANRFDANMRTGSDVWRSKYRRTVSRLRRWRVSAARDR